MKNIQTLSNISGISVRRFIFLSVITAGIYPVLWLNNTQNKFFDVFENKSWDSSLPTLISVIPFAAFVLSLLTPESAHGLVCFLAIVTYFVAWVHWSFKVRYDIISFAAIQYGLKLDINVGLTFLLGPVYIIHCINKIPLEYGIKEALKNLN